MFNENSSIVKNYVLLINVEEKFFEDVPDFSNLREMVAKVLANQDYGEETDLKEY